MRRGAGKADGAGTGRPVRVLMGGFITQVPAFIMIGLWIASQFMSVFAGQEDGVAYWAHIGGFIVGLILTIPLRTMVANRPAVASLSLIHI